MSDAYQILRDKEAARKAEYQAWLLSLKAGDQYALASSTWGRNSYRILTIGRITATQIVCEGRALEARIDRKTGRVRGGTCGQQIEPVTQEVRDTLELQNLRYWLTGIERNTISLPVMRAMRQAFDTATVAEDKKKAKS